MVNMPLCDNEHTVHTDEEVSDHGSMIWVTCGDTELGRRWFTTADDPEFVRCWTVLVLTEHTNQLQAEQIQRLLKALVGESED